MFHSKVKPCHAIFIVWTWKKDIFSYFIMLTSAFNRIWRQVLGPFWIMCLILLFFLVHYHWQNWILRNPMKDAKHLSCFKNLELNREKEDRNRKLETWRACKRNTHQRNITVFCCCCGRREELHAASAGIVHCRAYICTPSQESFVSSYDVLAYFWNKLAHHHLSLNSPFTLWFFSACPWWVSNAFMMSCSSWHWPSQCLC